MSYTAISIGPDARLSVGGVMFGIVSHDITDAGEEVDPSDSESLVGGYRNCDTGVNMLSMSFTCKRNADVSPHVAPYNLTPRRGQKVALRLYPDGTGSDYYDLPSFVVGNWKSHGDNSRSEPQTLSFDGKHDGAPVLMGGTA